MGEVFKAHDQSLDRWVALKLLHHTGPTSARQWVLEAQFQAAVVHESVVPVHEVGTLEGRPCIVMAYIPGATLAEWQEKLDLNQVCMLLAQACHGVHAAHCAGLIHRDLKPQNILVHTSEEGSLRAYVTDFGLARGAQSGSLSSTGMALGTPYFFSPEQAVGESLLDARSDVFSLGATLYAMVTGRPPFKGLDEANPIVAPGSELQLLNQGTTSTSQLLAAVRRVLEDPLIPPRQLNAQTPRDLETILLKALEKEPNRRYPSALAFALDLERFLAGEPIQAQRPGLVRRLLHFRRHHPALARWVAALAVLAFLLPPVWLFFTRRAEARARVAQQVAAEAQQIAYQIRLAHMLPAHDRRPHLVWAQAQTEILHRQLIQAGTDAQGPYAFLQGLYLAQMDHPTQAQAALERAWNLGFRTPEVAHALAEAAMESYLASLATLAPGQHLEQSRRRTLDLLQQAQVRGLGPPLVLARLAFLEGDAERALALAHQALTATPWAYEIHLFCGQVWIHRLGEAQTFAACESIVGKALEAFERAIVLAPSDPKSYAWKSFALRQLARRRSVYLGEPTEALLGAAIAACEAGEKVDPSYTRLPAHRALARYVRIRQGPQRRKLGFHHPEVQLMLADSRRAMDLDSVDPIAVAARAWTLEAQAHRAWLEQIPQVDRLFQANLAEIGQLVAQHPQQVAPRLALAYVSSIQEEVVREAGRDPQAAIQSTIQAYREGLNLMTQGHQALGEPGFFLVELAGEWIYLGEANLRFGQPAEALASVAQALAIFDDLEPIHAQEPRVANDRAWSHLIQAEAHLRLGEPFAGDLAQAQALMPHLRLGLGDYQPMRIPPYEEALFQARNQIRLGQDPRPSLARCRALAKAELSLHPTARHAQRYLAQAALEEVLWALPKGLSARLVAQEGQQGLTGWAGVELRDTSARFAAAAFHWAIEGDPEGTKLAQMMALAKADAFLGADTRVALAQLQRVNSTRKSHP